MRYQHTEVRTRGFTLIEMIGALALAAIGLVILLQVLRETTELDLHAEGATGAALRARSLLAEVGGPIPLKPGAYQGQTQQGYAWQMTIAPWYASEDPGLNFAQGGSPLLAIRLQLHWHGHHAQFETLRPAPPLTAAPPAP
ncbi:prepilin-type N-terminal cleavage/methylation domain-containing protein [Metallibacterium scheffleri]|uniref:General secretion pathway protein GspI n=1 Tax=Metallibacterium scheffleri TaxID=993689 RepID=A0A4S3KEN5_9GAMM|nr:prepilin-type N-terminal cleavage/methylation domain-containing protein [Metallibacterium scheffleri]THD07002.1 hypothetical protein B1806_15575 [Metallibacterium scheffleri]